MLAANPQIGHANMPSPQSEIERYLRSGEHDPLFGAWPGGNVLECARRGDADLRRALVAEVKARTAAVSVPEALIDLDCEAFARAKVAPMVRGLFPIVEQPAVLDMLARSLVFLTPSTIEAVLNRGFPSTAWDLANLYLLSCGAEPLADDAPRIVGMSEDTTCFVSMDYFRANHRFADFVVHEAAHVFHNCERRTLGLPATRRREWLLEIAFGKRETFAGFLSSATAFSHRAGFIRSLRGKPRHQMNWCATRNMLTSFAQLYAPETAGRRSSQRAHHRERVARDPRMIRYDAAVTFVRGSREFSLCGDTGESAISFPRPRAISPHRRRSTCTMAKVRGNVCCLSKTGDPGLEFAYATHFV
jgi:hypothetical protein